MKFHLHRYRVSTYMFPHAFCVLCGKVTFRLWWPMWREAK